MGDDSEWMKLPTDEKCVHKVWKARVAGYEEATKLFNTIDDPKSPEFSKYLGLVKKFVTDNNAVAQEKALDVVLVYVENAHVAGRTTGEVVNGVVTKCLNSARTKTKEKGLEVIMLYIEAEKQEVVQDELMKGLANKQPKVVAGCVQALREALRDFGSKIITIKPLVKQIQRLLEDRDKLVREEGKQLVKEIYRWIGAALKPQLANLKPVQITELEAEFDQMPPGKPHQTRFLRSQQDLKAKMESQAATAAAGGEEDVGGDEADAAPEVDPYDLMDPVDILSKLPKDFYDKLEAKKWQERKESLEALQKLLENPKLEQGDYGDVVRSLKKVVAKDTNVMLVTIAAKCMGSLAIGLRKKFSSYAPGCIDVVLEKFREKKVAVVAALKDASDAIFLTTSLDPISETCVEYLGHKTPSVKAETAAFMARAFTRCTPATLPKKMLKIFVAPLLKTVNDTAPEVREASFVALGTAMKVVGEKPLAPFISDVDSIKLGKIKEACEKAEVVGKAGKPKTEPAAAAKPAAAPGKPGVKPGAKTKAKKKGGGPAKGKGKDTGTKEVIENALSDEAIEEKIQAMLPADTIKGLSSANWKDRLGSMEKFTEVVKGMTKDEIPAQVCVCSIAKKPGLKENNFQVMKLKVELIAHLAKNSMFTKTSANVCLTDLVDKIGDVKNGAAVHETLSCIAEATSLEFITTEAVRYAFTQKNPKNQAETLVWLTNGIRDFGLKVNVKPLIETIKKALAATNPGVRTAGINLMPMLYMYMGAPLRMLFENEKPALLQQIDAEFAKVEGQKPAPPTRGLTTAEEGAEEADEDEETGESNEGPSVADLVPRTDISEQIKDSTLEEMADKNWKVRNEALQKIIAILNEAKFIKPTIGSLPESLKLRLADSNKILVSTTLSICQTLATAMGPNIKQHIRVVGPMLIHKNTLGDSKPMLRATAIATLNAWVEQGGLREFVEAEIIYDGLKTENPFLRAELLGWLSEKLPNTKKLPPEFGMCVPVLFACLEDRNPDVRKKAQEAILPFMIHQGYESMIKQAGKLKASSKDLALGFIEKAKPDLPQKPVKAKAAPAKAAAAPVKSKPTASVSPVSYDEEEEERPATAPAKSSAPAGKGKAKPGAKKPAPVSSKKKDVDEDTSPPLKVSNGKEQRFKEEKTLKVLKWNFGAPRGEFIDQLKAQMEPTFNTTMMTQLFHADFKMHIKAIETLTKATSELPEATIANADTILKWVTLRFFDTNTSVLLKALDYLVCLFSMLASEDYHLQELEAIAFVPYLVNKVGDPKDNVRKGVRNLFKLICKVYPASKMFSYIIDGLKSKNSKQRTECLEELGILIDVYGINVCQPSPAQAVKIVAQQISDRDNSVRSSALNTVVAAYHILGDTVHKYLGNMTDKDLGMLEERIKRSSKTRVAIIPPSQPEPTRTSPEERPKVARIPPNKQRQAMEPPVQQPTVKKEFMLDPEFMDDLEDENTREDGVMPSLVEHNIDSVLYEPVKLPQTRMRPPSPSMKLLSSSNDAKAALDLVISQVASNDVNTSIQALVQIDGVLKDEVKSAAMLPHVDQFLVVCSLQLRIGYSKHMASTDDNAKTDVIKLYKCLLGSLLTLFQSKVLAKKVTSRDVTKDLFHILITILLDQRLNELTEGPQVVRSVNIMVVKIVEKGDCSNVLSALMRLLTDSMETETCSTRFLELIMKCMWKMVRMMPDIHSDLNVAMVLKDIHHFMETFPSGWWKTRANDMPLRTVKTILHTLAKVKGNKIMSHLNDPEMQNSEVESYLKKVLKTGMDYNTVSNTNTKNEQMNGTPEVELRMGKREGAKSSKRLSKSTHDMLAEIFKKIGSKENTREGLNDLFDFKQKYPEADLDPFLKKSSTFFQNYIERGLKNIEIERDGKMKQSSSAPNMSASSSTSSITSMGSASADNDCTPAMYMERLKVLRARCGLDNPKSDLTSANGPPTYPVDPSTLRQSTTAPVKLDGSSSSLSSNSSSGVNFDAKLNAAPVNTNITNNPPDNIENMDNENCPTSVNLSELKQRLERIKNAARK